MRRWIYVIVSLLVCGVLAGLIFQKENLLRKGRTVFLRQAPVDPRSLRGRVLGGDGEQRRRGERHGQQG